VNGAIDLSISIGGAFFYEWSNNATSQDITGLAAGNYSVTVTDASGCSVSDSYSIPANTNPPNVTVEMTIPDCTVSVGAIHINIITGGTPPLNFSIDGGLSFSDSPTFDQVSPGNYQVVVLDASNCTDELLIHIPQPVIPVVIPIPEISLELGGSEAIQVHLQPGYPVLLLDTVIWEPSAGLTFRGTGIVDLLNPTVTGFEDQEYRVTVIAGNGCQDQTVFRVKVEEKRNLFVPNVFSPDSDGDHTGFTLYSGPGMIREILTLKIFDRWGNEIFTREHFEPGIPALGWHGDFRGNPMNPAVFVWWAQVVWADGMQSIYKGDVTVVR
jgi:hypothetical protein